MIEPTSALSITWLAERESVYVALWIPFWQFAFIFTLSPTFLPKLGVIIICWEGDCLLFAIRGESVGGGGKGMTVWQGYKWCSPLLVLLLHFLFSPSFSLFSSFFFFLFLFFSSFSFPFSFSLRRIGNNQRLIEYTMWLIVITHQPKL